MIFAWIGGRNFRPIPGLAHCRGSIDRPRHCERETHLPEARDAGEKGDGFKEGSLWDCRFNAVSDKPPPLLRTHLLPIILDSFMFRGCVGEGPSNQRYDPRPFCDRGKFYFQFQRSFRPGRFVERKFRGRCIDSRGPLQFQFPSSRDTP